MTYNEYLNACMNFSKNTQDWGDVDSFKFYTTSDTGEGWEESPDNAHGGLDISWAFHRSADDIQKEAPSMYARKIVELVRSMVENESSYDTMWDALGSFED